MEDEKSNDYDSFLHAAIVDILHRCPTATPNVSIKRHIIDALDTLLGSGMLGLIVLMVLIGTIIYGNLWVLVFLPISGIFKAFLAISEFLTCFMLRQWRDHDR